MQLQISRVNGTPKVQLCNFNTSHPNWQPKTANNFSSTRLQNNYEATQIERANISAYKNGIALKIAFTVKNNLKKPLKNVKIHVAHCDANGIDANDYYNGSAGENWLTGYQLTNKDGNCNFETIFPGWQSGRVTHIKLTITLPNGYIERRNIYLPKNILNLVYQTPHYTKGINPIAITGDVSLQGDIKTYNKNLLQIKGNLTTGYNGFFDLML